MESVYYDYEYFRKLLLQKKNFEYEKYKDYDVQDIMIECLNDETIYDYYSLDGNMFYYYFFYPNRSEPWDDEICPGKPFDDFSNLFISPEVRLKVMLFIQQNAEEIWPHTNYLLVQEECSRIIHKTLKRLEESNFTYNMPRPNYRELLYSPHFLTEKTPSRRWSEEHNLDKSAIPAIKSHDQDDVEDEVTVEQSQNEEQPVEINKSEEEVNHVEENDFPAEAVPQEVPDSVIFNTSYWKPDDCKKEFKHIINACPEKRGKQMVIKKIREQSSYFHCNALRHKAFAEELNRLQNKFKFTKADVDHAFGR